MTSIPAPETTSEGDLAAGRLKHTQLRLARLAWIALAVLYLGIFALSIPYHIIYISSRLPVNLSTALMQQGVSVNFYIGFLLINEIAIVLGYSTAALAIFLLKSDDWMSIYVSAAMLTFGVTISSLEASSSPLNSLSLYRPALETFVLLLQVVGLGSFMLVFYLFPDGHFIPRWTRYAAVVWIGWLMAWLFLPGLNSAPTLSPSAQFIMRMFMTDTGVVERLHSTLHSYSLIVADVIFFGAGVYAQIYRYQRVATPLQRRQTKWAVFGMVATALLYFVVHVLPPFVFIALQTPGLTYLRYSLLSLPITTLALLLVPFTMAISVHRYRLWDVDYLINRALVYGALSAVSLGLYLGVVLVSQALLASVIGMQSALFIVLSTLAVATLLQPLRRHLQHWIDRRFYREQVSFRQVFTSFAREVRTIIDLPVLLRTLVQRTTALLHIEYGAVFLLDGNQQLQLSEQQDLPGALHSGWEPRPGQMEKLRAGQAIAQPRDKAFPMLVPLIAPQSPSTNSDTLLGILALGPQRSGLAYSREDQALLLGLADQAGTAIYVARLIQANQQETERRMEAEQHLEAHRSSPLGQAELLAQELAADPPAAPHFIHQLAQDAGKDHAKASMVNNLPQALRNIQAERLAGVAEGYDYLFQSQFTPQLLPIGLRSLIKALQDMVTDEVCLNDACRAEFLQAIGIYWLCLQAYEARSITQIIEVKALADRWVDEHDGKKDCPEYLAQLNGIIGELQPAIEALQAYERVDSPGDKVAYLASAVNGLRHAGHLARTQLAGADQPVLEHIAESWLAIVSSAISELQTSARLVCRLLTRHTWQGDIISLALSVTNQGRGAALQLKVTLVPGPEYTLIDDSALIERLPPGEEAQVHLRVRPRLSESDDHFRARFVILYTDPRGPDQVENFADVVHLLATSGEFQFIPNPYVVGTPLKTGSPLFFGREDVVQFIQANLSASHRNNLVLIGQRRTGKTSLLKQLPARLGDESLPVYLDGQALGLDPGMPNFFLNLATEIAFALDDHGYTITPPELEDFQASPAGAFERSFLEQVRRQIGNRHLLIMFDEFEEMETAVRRGSLDPSIFGFLRHLVQHQPDLSVIFCGTHRLEQLAADYWSVLFNISLYQHIAFLERDEALRLIEQPVAAYGMRYDDLALDKIWRVTAGHPYFLQLLCHSLVNHHNKTGRSYVTIADVNTALDDILASGEAHFVYLWAESTSEERLILTALSRMIPLTGQASVAQIAAFFEERSLNLERQSIQSALHHLMLRDILQSTLQGGSAILADQAEAYRWKLGLLGLWVERYKSLNRVIDEDFHRPAPAPAETP